MQGRDKRGMFFYRNPQHESSQNSNQQGRYPKGSKKKSEYLIQNPQQPLKVWNPKFQTWESEQWNNNINDVFVEASSKTLEHFKSAIQWNELNIPEVFYENILTNFKYTQPSKIQAFALPLILEEPPQHLIAQAHNGTGKTLCFAIGSLCRVDPSIDGLQVIVLAHTRELIQQIFDVYRKLSNKTGIRIALMLSQFEVPNDVGHVLITTPGSLIACFRKSMIATDYTRVLVIDEADIMFDNEGQLQFLDTTTAIMDQCPTSTQTLCFSATYKDQIRQQLKTIIPEAHKIQINKVLLTLEGVKQFFVHVDKSQKLEILGQIFTIDNLGQIIIFVNSKKFSIRIVDILRQKSYKCALIISDMPPQERDSTLEDFKAQKSRVLVTTNLLSRGIDITTVSLIVNFDIPQKLIQSQEKQVDFETYLHRIGRTGRFGRLGLAVSIVTDERQIQQINEIQEYYQSEINEIYDVNELAQVFKEQQGMTVEEQKVSQYD